MAIPGFTADESVGPTLQVYRTPPSTHAPRGLSPQNLDVEEMTGDDGDDLDEDGDDLDDDVDAADDEGTTEEDSSGGDA